MQKGQRPMLGISRMPVSIATLQANTHYGLWRSESCFKEVKELAHCVQKGTVTISAPFTSLFRTQLDWTRLENLCAICVIGQPRAFNKYHNIYFFLMTTRRKRKKVYVSQKPNSHKICFSSCHRGGSVPLWCGSTENLRLYCGVWHQDVGSGSFGLLSVTKVVFWLNALHM